MKKTELKSCPIFADLTDSELDLAIDFFSCSQRSYKKGEIILTPENKLVNFGLVISGAVQTYTLDIDGYEMIMATVQAGETFGESLSYLQKEAVIFISALYDTTVVWMSTDKIRAQHFENECERKLAYRFTALLANRALSMNDRIQILSRLTIREKLIAMFTESVRKYGGTSFTLPFDRTSMATYLGCDRASLSRELSKLQKEGLIKFTKNKFEILKISDNTMNFG